jgi:hypothetical protein
MKTTQAVLAALQASGGEVRGRTQLQKVIYLAAAQAGISLPYRAHYYGPYSREIAAEADCLVESGVIDEEVHSTSRGGSSDRRFHIYRLADDVGDVVASVKPDAGAEWDRFQDAVQRVCALDKGYEPLSLAAKIHWVLSEAGKPIAIEDARAMAADLKWDLSPEDVNQALGILSDLEMVTVQQSDA